MAALLKNNEKSKKTGKSAGKKKYEDFKPRDVFEGLDAIVEEDFAAERKALEERKKQQQADVHDPEFASLGLLIEDMDSLSLVADSALKPGKPIALAESIVPSKTKAAGSSNLKASLHPYARKVKVDYLEEKDDFSLVAPEGRKNKKKQKSLPLEEKKGKKKKATAREFHGPNAEETKIVNYDLEHPKFVDVKRKVPLKQATALLRTPTGLLRTSKEVQSISKKKKEAQVKRNAAERHQARLDARKEYVETGKMVPKLFQEDWKNPFGEVEEKKLEDEKNKKERPKLTLAEVERRERRKNALLFRELKARERIQRRARKVEAKERRKAAKLVTEAADVVPSNGDSMVRDGWGDVVPLPESCALSRWRNDSCCCECPPCIRGECEQCTGHVHHEAAGYVRCGCVDIPVEEMPVSEGADVRDDLHRFFLAPDSLNSLKRELLRNPVLKQLMTEADGYIDDIARAIALIYLLRRQTTRWGFFSVVFLWLGGRNTVGKTVAALLASRVAVALSAKPPPAIETEGLSDVVKQGSDMLSYVFDSEAMTALRDVLVCGSAMKMFDKEIAFKVYGYFGKPKAGDMIDLLRSFLDGLATLIRVGELLLEGVPMSEALFSKNPLIKTLSMAKELLLYRDKLYTGLPTPGWMDQCTFMSRAEEYLSFLNAALERMSAVSLKYKDCVSTRLELLEAVSTVRNQVAGTSRAAPFAIAIAGPPGIGKSYLLRFMTQLWSEVKQRPHSESLLFSRSMTSEYWEGYLPFSKPYIHYSEVGASHRDVVRSQGDDVLKELTSLIDTMPFSVNMAFDGKGKIFAIPELVVADTNNVDMNLGVLVNNPSAYQRRFLYVEPVVKPEYRKEGSCSIDTAKTEDGSRFLDKWTFRVYRKTPTSNSSAVEERILSGTPADNIDVFADVLRKLFSQHIEKESKLRDRVEDPQAFAGENYGVFEGKEVRSEALDVASVVKAACRTERVSLSKSWDFVSGLAPLLTSCVTCHFLAWGLEGTSYFLERNRKSLSPVDVVWWRWVIFLLLRWLFLPTFLSAVVFVNWNWVFSFFQEQAVAGLSDKLYSQRSHYWTRVRVYCGWADVSEAFMSKDHVKSYGKIAILTAGIAGIAYVISRWLSDNDVQSEAFSEFKDPGPWDKELNDMEETFHCGRSYTRIPSKVGSQWNVMVPKVLSKHTSTLSSLSEACARNVRYAHVTSSDRQVRTYVLGISKNYAVINTHTLGKSRSDISIRVSATGKASGDDVFKTTRLRPCDWKDLGNDISLVRLSEVLFRDITAHIADDDYVAPFAEGMIASHGTHVKFVGRVTANDPVVGPIPLERVFQYKWISHEPGKCGLPLFTQRDKNCALVGIHAAGNAHGEEAFASAIPRDALLAAIGDFEKSEDLLVVHSESGDVSFDTEEPSARSPFRFVHLPGLDYMGKFPGEVCLNNKTNLVKSVFAKSGALHDVFYETLSFVPNVHFLPPVMKPVERHGQYISPINNGLMKMAVEKMPLDRDILAKVKSILVDRFVSQLRGRGVVTLQPLTVECAVNGAREDPFMRRISASTSGGWGFPGSKGVHIPIVEETQSDITREPVAVVKARLIEILRRYQGGECNHFVYTANLKDEPRPSEKVAVGNTRVFFGSPLDNLIVSKMFLSPFYTLMIEHSDIFMTSIGIDMHREAHDLYARLANFSEQLIEGDYGGYDTSMPFEIGLTASGVVSDVLREMGYTTESMQVVRGLLSDGLFPVVEFNRDVFVATALQPSGKYATAEDNSLRNLILLMYAWYSMPCRDLNFFDYVLPNVYGDDVDAAVKPEAQKWFNNLTYSDFVARNYGMKFTPAAKFGEFEVFVDVRDMFFLKRRFVHSTVLDRVVAPLDMNSLYKTLEWLTPSKVVNASVQYLSIVNSVLREFFFHLDRVQFDLVRSRLVRTLVEELKFERSDAEGATITFEFLVSQLRGDECSTAMDVKEGRRLDEDDTNDERCYYLVTECLVEEGLKIPSQNNEKQQTVFSTFGRVGRRTQGPAKFLETLMNERNIVMEELKEADDMLSQYPMPLEHLTIGEARMSHQYAADVDFRNAVDRHARAHANYHSRLSTVDSLNRSIALLRNRMEIRTESMDVSVMEKGAISNGLVEVHENVQDVDGDAEDKTDVGVSLYNGLLDHTSLELNDFFARPVQIATINFALATDVNYTNRVWSNYLANPTVRAKLRNYAFISGTLHVRISLAGTPFHYGKLMVSYVPLPDSNEVAARYAALPVTNHRQELLKWLSQIPGTKVMDPKDNAPLEFTLPYVNFKRSIRLFNDQATVISDSADFLDAYNLGIMFFMSLNQLNSTAAGATGATAYVYAWMTDVRLGCPTGTQMTITTESRDERIVGPVERYATRAAEVASAVATVPWIGLYAKASAMVLRGLSGFAAIFGWSRPIMQTRPGRVKNEPFQNACQVTGYDTGQKMSLDPLQELTVDPRVCGVVEDELAFSYLVTQESLLDQFSWLPADAQYAPIWSVVVNPRVVWSNTISKRYVQPSALFFAASPFLFWRGDISYRFEVVCSAFHRGKIGFLFDPNIAQYVLINGSIKLNKQHMFILDIQEAQTVEICVQWAHHRDWARVCDASAYTTVGTQFSPTSKAAFANGFVTVFPITKLESPDSSSVPINAYIKGGENMKFNGITNQRFPIDMVWTESKDVRTIDPTSCIVLNESCSDDSHINELFFGEMPTSFRALLKRFLPTTGLTNPGNTGSTNKLYKAYLEVYPKLWPNVAGTGWSGGNYNSLLSYLRYAYVGMRGGIRKRLRFTGSVSGDSLANLKVFFSNATTASVSGTTPVMLLDTANTLINPAFQGSVAFVPSTNGGVEVELPCYTPNLFLAAGSILPFEVDTYNQDSLGFKAYHAEIEAPGSQGVVAFAEESCAAEDFMLMRFLAAPPFCGTV